MYERRKIIDMHYYLSTLTLPYGGIFDVVLVDIDHLPFQRLGEENWRRSEHLTYRYW